MSDTTLFFEKIHVSDVRGTTEKGASCAVYAGLIYENEARAGAPTGVGYWLATGKEYLSLSEAPDVTQFSVTRELQQELVGEDDDLHPIYFARIPCGEDWELFVCFDEGGNLIEMTLGDEPLYGYVRSGVFNLWDGDDPRPREARHLMAHVGIGDDGQPLVRAALIPVDENGRAAYTDDFEALRRDGDVHKGRLPTYLGNDNGQASVEVTLEDGQVWATITRSSGNLIECLLE